ncbi:MAG TPA: hypothetical protein PLP42_14220 [Acidobacteriota bacterium]|nr:hypothetical protein [Acidobacteriota bacterium]
MVRMIVVLSLSVLGFAQTIDQVVIPRKTEIFFTLERAISTRTARAGDKFYGRVSVPVTIDDRIIVPVGSYLIGHVDATKRAERVGPEGQIRLEFDTIILPDGTTRAIRAITSSAEGYEAADEEGKIEASGGQTEQIISDAEKGAKIGALGGVGGTIATGSVKALGIGIGAGAATGAILGILRRNNEVELPKGASITVLLDTDIRFEKPTPPPKGEPL